MTDALTDVWRTDRPVLWNGHLIRLNQDDLDSCWALANTMWEEVCRLEEMGTRLPELTLSCLQLRCRLLGILNASLLDQHAAASEAEAAGASL